MIKTNENAPVLARSEIEINAPPEKVWGVLADINQWPAWNGDIKSVSFNGKLEAGTTFQWKTGAGTITSTLQEVNPPEILAWTGKIMGIKAVHVYKLKFVGEKTVVSTEESWEGLLSRILQGYMQRTLQGSLDDGLQFLKDAVE